MVGDREHLYCSHGMQGAGSGTQRQLRWLVFAPNSTLAASLVTMSLSEGASAAG